MTPSKLLASYAEKAEQRPRSSRTSWISRWWGAIAAAFATLVAIAVFAYRSNQASKELARLRHEKNKREIEAKNAEVKKELAENSEKIEALSKEADQAREIVKITEDRIRKIENARDADQAAIDKIKSWGDV